MYECMYAVLLLKQYILYLSNQNFADDGKCGETNWRAAGNKSKRKTHLDETGLEIAGCRHGLAQWAVNMFRGEIYGYANFIRVHKMIPNSVEYMWENIICKYWKWAKSIPDNGMGQQNMKPALSVMHAKAHNWSCQVLILLPIFPRQSQRVDLISNLPKIHHVVTLYAIL